VDLAVAHDVVAGAVAQVDGLVADGVHEQAVDDGVARAAKGDRGVGGAAGCEPEPADVGAVGHPDLVAGLRGAERGLQGLGVADVDDAKRCGRVVAGGGWRGARAG
jgi:hypothetical protein